MHIRSIGRVLLLVLAAALVTFSCTYDYWLDFSLGTPVFTVGQHTVSVPYTLQNNYQASLTMDNAAIHIEVTINGGVEMLEAWTTGVSLSPSENASGTLDFYFTNTVDSATAVVIGVHWDEASIDY
jgi:hypothetical protein